MISNITNKIISDGKKENDCLVAEGMHTPSYLLSIQKVDFETLPPTPSFPTEFLMTYLGMGKGISCNHTYNLISHKPPLIMSSLGGHL